MDFELPEEHRLLKEKVRRFVDRELSQMEREVVNDVAMQKQLPKRLRGRPRRLGSGCSTFRRSSAGWVSA